MVVTVKEPDSIITDRVIKNVCTLGFTKQK
jgi:hypothetical protein